MRQIGFLALRKHTTNCAWPAHGKFAGTFEQLGQYAGSPGNRAPVTQNWMFLGLDHHESMPTHGRMARLSWPGWLITYQDCECLV